MIRCAKYTAVVVIYWAMIGTSATLVLVCVPYIEPLFLLVDVYDTNYDNGNYVTPDSSMTDTRSRHIAVVQCHAITMIWIKNLFHTSNKLILFSNTALNRHFNII